MNIVQRVDALVEAPVLVFGQPPPHGRDLDLLVRPTDMKALADGLEAAGFTRHGKRFVSFHGCSADVVEVVPADDWGLPAAEVEELFGAAHPLDGAAKVLEPGPAHALLVLARRGYLKPKARVRAASILASDATALTEARRRAPVWGVAPELEALAEGRPPRPRRIGRPRRGTLVTLSGLDGAGKSSQAAALRDALERVGYDPVVVWTSLSQHPPLLHAITRLARWLLGPRRPDGRGEADPGRALRERSRFVTFAWSTVVALTNAMRQARAVAPHLWRGRVVICDRYTLDSKVHLRYAYGEERGFGFQAALIGHLSPRPGVAYLLDVSPETASTRKRDYPLEENARRGNLYLEEAEGLGVRRLDGERPREEICAQLAGEVWDFLAAR